MDNNKCVEFINIAKNLVEANVTEMISSGKAFMHLEGTVEELENMVFPHPTVSEALTEAAAVCGKGNSL